MGAGHNSALSPSQIESIVGIWKQRMPLKKHCSRLAAGGKPVLFTSSEYATRDLRLCTSSIVCAFAFISAIWRVTGDNTHSELPHYQPISFAFPRNWSIPLRGYLWSIFYWLSHLQTSSEVPLRHREGCMCITASLRHNSCPKTHIPPSGTIFSLAVWKSSQTCLSQTQLCL